MLTLQIGDRAGIELIELIAALAALVVTAGVVQAGVRAYRINLGRYVWPRIPVSALPAESSRSFAPLTRLAARERELAGHLTALPDAVAADTWIRASGGVRALRSHATLIMALENTGRSTDDEVAALDLLASRLREGVSTYERLTDTAAELLAQRGESAASGDARVRIDAATDALIGLTRGLAS
ncbi:MAG: hypothetical protein M3313_00865 [Actinomycetota bacterium]|nr:hypothetical protein [Actinomycetota bacterium]